MEEGLELKTIDELREYSFHVPAYQRGYRWTEREAVALLDDINDFTPRPIQNAGETTWTWYCLQPIVVKNMGGDRYEVIDGQQRLTTIYLILHCLNKDFTEPEELFEIDYKTRPRTAEFLQKLGSESKKDAKNNIDFNHIHRVYCAIKEWFDDPERDGKTFRINFGQKFKCNTKVIWYESAGEDARSVFTRLNIGKISLSNAELIKALFLKGSNSNDEKVKLKIKHKQLEISTEWDNIETELHDSTFWGFISDGEQSSNRIEFIFDIMSKKPKSSADPFYTFRHFSEEFDSNTFEETENEWKKVKGYFQRFHEWYSERELYHKIGYLLCVTNVRITDLHDKSSKMTKGEFKAHLGRQIHEGLRDVKLSELCYGDRDVRSVLLLYNILTMLKNDKENSRFPFGIFKNGGWDIEHVTAIQEDVSKKDRERWLKDVRHHIDTNKGEGRELDDRIHRFNEKSMDFNSLFTQIRNYFGEEDIEERRLNHISNLALLDSGTNRGYKNAVFPVKRATIIDRDKSGVFIPICTKNVFLKYFADYPPEKPFWTKEDREKYEEDLKATLKGYLEEERNG